MRDNPGAGTKPFYPPTRLNDMTMAVTPVFPPSLNLNLNPHPSSLAPVPRIPFPSPDDADFIGEPPVGHDLVAAGLITYDVQAASPARWKKTECASC